MYTKRIDLNPDWSNEMKTAKVLDLRTKKVIVSIPEIILPAKKTRSSARISAHAANIDFNTFRIYLRLKKVKPKDAELYENILSPKNNIYAKTEDELLRNIKKILKEHIEKAIQLDKLLGKKDIPVVYINEAKEGAIIDLEG